MKIMGMGILDLAGLVAPLLPFLVLAAVVYAAIAFVRSRKVASSLSSDGQEQGVAKEKYIRKAIAGVVVALVCVALLQFSHM